jgi:hypothetical protein
VFIVRRHLHLRALFRVICQWVPSSAGIIHGQSSLVSGLRSLFNGAGARCPVDSLCFLKVPSRAGGSYLWSSLLGKILRCSATSPGRLQLAPPRHGYQSRFGTSFLVIFSTIPYTEVSDMSRPLIGNTSVVIADELRCSCEFMAIDIVSTLFSSTLIHPPVPTSIKIPPYKLILIDVGVANAQSTLISINPSVIVTAYFWGARFLTVCIHPLSKDCTRHISRSSPVSRCGLVNRQGKSRYLPRMNIEMKFTAEMLCPMGH